MATLITLQVWPDVGLSLQGMRPRTPEAVQLLRTAKNLGIVINPMHPGATDPLLVPYFSVEVPDAQTAEQIAARLRRCKGVEAAYVKPPEGPP